ncbi:MAG: hypothetical protein FWD73_11860 [Polyangiaceae bacterium]|nr:hypothetical protein [Polyangiaceae bacterium]
MFTSLARGCARCKAELEETSTAYPLEILPQVQQAVTLVGQGNFDGLVRLQGAPIANTEQMAALLVFHCPKCKSVAELASATRVSKPGEDAVNKSISSKVPIVGPQVKYVLDMVSQRNTAWACAVHGRR